MPNAPSEIASPRGARRRPRSSPRPMTMTPVEVLDRLNALHRDVIFPRLFGTDVTFTMVREMDYNFTLDARKRFRVTHSQFWLNNDRTEGYLIEFPAGDEEGRTMGRLIHHVVDPNCVKVHGTGKLGYTADFTAIDADKYDVIAAQACPRP